MGHSLSLKYACAHITRPHIATVTLAAVVVLVVVVVRNHMGHSLSLKYACTHIIRPHIATVTLTAHHAHFWADVVLIFS